MTQPDNGRSPSGRAAYEPAGDVGELVERLLAWADSGDMGRGPDPSDMRRQAADALTRLAAENVALKAQIAAVGGAVVPVLDWYQSDEHEPRMLSNIIADIVADLQSDRKDALRLAAERERAAALAGAVNLAIVWFDEYALLHRAKGTADGNDKGQRNQDRADQLRQALTAYKESRDANT